MKAHQARPIEISETAFSPSVSIPSAIFSIKLANSHSNEVVFCCLESMHIQQTTKPKTPAKKHKQTYKRRQRNKNHTQIFLPNHSDCSQIKTDTCITMSEQNIRGTCRSSYTTTCALTNTDFRASWCVPTAHMLLSITIPTNEISFISWERALIMFSTCI